jgi:multiple sugar transport system permease protein
MGYASALAWLLFIVLVIVTVAQFKLADRWVYYEGDVRQ